MTRRAPRKTPLIALALTAGCATTPTLSTVPDDPFAAERAAVAERIAVPTADLMLPDVEMVGYPRRIFGELHRDSIRGAEPVSRWLEEIRARSSAAGEPFELRATTIQICNGAAVEDGRYTIPEEVAPDQIRSRDRSRRYLALWRPVAGEWKLKRLWLDPDTDVRMASVAAGCGMSMRAERESRRFRLGVGGRVGGGAGLADIAALMEEDGWPAPDIHNRSAAGVKVWASYRFTAALAVRPSYERIGRTRLHAYREVASGFRTLNADVDGHLVTLVVEWQRGPLWLGAGPGLAFMTTEYDDRVNTSRSRTSDPGVVPERRLGGEVEAGVRVTRLPTILPVLSLGYTYFPELNPGVSQYPAAVPLGGFVLSLGLEMPF